MNEAEKSVMDALEELAGDRSLSKVEYREALERIQCEIECSLDAIRCEIEQEQATAQ